MDYCISMSFAFGDLTNLSRLDDSHLDYAERLRTVTALASLCLCAHCLKFGAVAADCKTATRTHTNHFVAEGFNLDTRF